MAKKNTLSNAAKAKSGGYSASIEELKKKVAGDDERRKRLNVEIPESLHTELKVYATRHGASMTDIVEGLLREYLGE
ncbi:plasmid partition protein ParG [Salisaeta longa]|uniref:plasmid partition protein ParG n=1 Tax=Salisaeta longa TaxID=503170 RepID=UPI0003B433E6|nr:plasmid partition protein ParG [Salisaeta longa]